MPMTSLPPQRPRAGGLHARARREEGIAHTLTVSMVVCDEVQGATTTTWVAAAFLGRLRCQEEKVKGLKFGARGRLGARGGR